MEVLAVLVATFVLSFIAGFGWRTGSVAARLTGRVLRRQRDTSSGSQKVRGASEASRISSHEADESAT